MSTLKRLAAALLFFAILACLSITGHTQRNPIRGDPS